MEIPCKNCNIPVCISCEDKGICPICGEDVLEQRDIPKSTLPPLACKIDLGIEY